MLTCVGIVNHLLGDDSIQEKFLIKTFTNLFYSLLQKNGVEATEELHQNS
jgi:hypothetical protein